MKRAGWGNNVVGFVVLAACVAGNVWLFRRGILFGLVGLNITKHVAVAVLCQAIGIGKTKPAPTFRPAHLSLPRPHSLVGETP